ncbi:MAG TPA: dihydrofolate reductase family protein [Gaiellaceae bacterium]|nr:dihydrofolate reductase family protein [Gaiellaceae bacterium]
MSLELLWERKGLPAGELPEALQSFYAGGFALEPPRVYANFVETIDGIVAIPEHERSNALVADESDDDKHVMGMLRAFADCVLIGSGTLLASPKGRWRPEGVYPAAAAAFAELRSRLGKPEHPAVAVVTTGASLDTSHRVLEHAVVLTTAGGAELLQGVVPDVVAVNDGDWVDLRAAIAVLRERGHELVLAEAGPTTFGGLLAEGLVDELFLTLSPVLAGRIGVGHRLALVEGVELLPEVRISPRLLSLRRGGEHLFLRYGFS